MYIHVYMYMYNYIGVSHCACVCACVCVYRKAYTNVNMFDKCFSIVRTTCLYNNLYYD